MRRVSSPIRTVVNCVMVGCIGVTALVFNARVMPVLRRQQANRDVWCAAITDHPGDLRAALEAGGDPNARNPANEPGLMVAAHNGNTACVRLLLQYKANPNIRGSQSSTPLIHAARNAHPDIVALLLASGADPNLADDKGDTPLIMSAMMGDVPSLQRLMGAGANPRMPNLQNATPLSTARQWRHGDIEVLLNRAIAWQ